MYAHDGDHDAKNRHGKGKPSGCAIYGTVLDSITSKPIEYASISIIDMDGGIITGGITDPEGKFNIQEIKPGTYDVKIEYMGFSSVSINNIKLSFREQPIEILGEIKLKPTSLEIDAVNVIDKKPIFEFEADKMIYNSSDDIVSSSGTAEDVLNKVPMVTVDSEGEVSLRGNPNVKILINGRPNREGGDVDNIPASLIDKVEVITSPSAKYDPEGMAGIINIELKKGKYEGFNGSIKLNGKHNDFKSVDDMNGTTFYSNYKTEKYNLYSSLSINNRARIRIGTREVYNQIADSIYYDIDGYKYDSETDGSGNSISLKIGSDYLINDQLNINGELSYKINKKSKLISQNYFQDGFNDADYLELSEEGDKNGNYHIESFFELIKSYENPDKEVYCSLSNHYGSDNEFEKQGDLITNVTENEDNYELDFNFKTPINEQSKLEIGYDGRFFDSKENMDFELLGFKGINDFNMIRNIHGLFVEYQLQLNEKFSIKPSYRIEYVDKKIEFLKISDEITSAISSYAQYLHEIDDSTVNINEINNFPDLHFTYNITDKRSIQAGISRRIERPGGGSHGSWGQLRPFPRNVYNDSFIFLGNVFLKPEFSTQYEISYKGPMPMGFFYTNLYYRDVANSIEWYDFDGENNDIPTNIITFKNADAATDLGIELFMMIMGQTLGGGYNVNELNDSSNDFQLNGKNERMNIYMRINLPEENIKLFSYEFGFYYMKMKVPGGTLFGDKGTLWANTGISKSLFDDRASISFSINNIFDKGGFQMFSYEPVVDSNNINALQYTDVFSTRGGRTFSISLKYNFGEMQEEKRKNRRGQGFGGSESMDMGY